MRQTAAAFAAVSALTVRSNLRAMLIALVCRCTGLLRCLTTSWLVNAFVTVRFADECVLVRLKKQKCIPSAEGMGVALTTAFAASSEILENLSMSPENTGGGLEDWRELGCLFPPAMAPRPAPRPTPTRNLSIVKIDFNFSADLSGKHCVYGGFPGVFAPSLTSRATATYLWSEVVRKWSEMDQSSFWQIKYLSGPMVVRWRSDL